MGVRKPLFRPPGGGQEGWPLRELMGVEKGTVEGCCFQTPKLFAFEK